MRIIEGIKTLLLAESTVSTLLGEATKGVYTDYATQNAVYPFVLLGFVSRDPYLTLGAKSGMQSCNIVIECKARTRAESRALADAVETYIDDYSGSAGSDTINAVWIGDRNQDVEAPDAQSEKTVFVDSIEAQIQWTPA